MFELPSAIFLIADGNEFRFARFYIVCEEVPLGTPESPPIVSGVSDMHPPDCPNVEETRNPMQTFSRKKCSHFFPTNILSAFPHEIPKSVSDNITYHSQEIYAYRGNSFFNRGLQQLDSALFACLHHLIRPQGGLHLADVRLAQEKHTDTGLTDTAADGVRQLAF